MARRAAAAPRGQHPADAAVACVFSVLPEHGRHERCFPADFRAVRARGVGHGRSDAAGCTAGGAANTGRQPGQHADPDGQPAKPVSVRAGRGRVCCILQLDAAVCGAFRVVHRRTLRGTAHRTAGKPCAEHPAAAPAEPAAVHSRLCTLPAWGVRGAAAGRAGRRSIHLFAPG